MTTKVIGSALDRVLHSKTFARSRSLQDFLTFIVTQSLEPDQNLKEYRVGVDALKRGGAFNPAENSIVRVQAYRLRAKLADYYQHEGRAEGVRIALEPGSYTPVIRECTVVMTLGCLRFPGLVLDLLPFDPSPQTDAATVVYTVFFSALDRLLRASLHGRNSAGGKPRAHLQLDFRVRSGPGGLRMILYLSDAGSQSVLWSHARTVLPGSSMSELRITLEQAGLEKAEAVSRKIDAITAGNG